jgi:hypothetical protein
MYISLKRSNPFWSYKEPFYTLLSTSMHTTWTIYFIFIDPITKVGTLIVATIYLQLIQNRYMFRNLTVLQCSHQCCVQPVASDVEVVGYL